MIPTTAATTTGDGNHATPSSEVVNTTNKRSGEGTKDVSDQMDNEEQVMGEDYGNEEHNDDPNEKINQEEGTLPFCYYFAQAML